MRRGRTASSSCATGASWTKPDRRPRRSSPSDRPRDRVDRRPAAEDRPTKHPPRPLAEPPHRHPHPRAGGGDGRPRDGHQEITPTAERSATDQMGQADVLVYPGPGGDEAALRELLPPGSTCEPMFATSETLVVPGVAVSVTLRSHDPEGIGRGMLTLVSG